MGFHVSLGECICAPPQSLNPKPQKYKIDAGININPDP